MQTYSDLVAGIQAWLSRTGDAKITGNVADLVALCEDMIAYGNADPQFSAQPLRCRGMETPAQIVISTPVTVSAVGGTPNAITLTPSVALSSYTNGVLYQFTPSANNTSAVTVNVSSLGAVALVQGASRSALAGNELIAGGTYNIYYDGINSVWVLLPELSHAPLPKDYLAMRAWYYIWQPGIPRPLSYMTPGQVNDIAEPLTSGPPKNFTIEADAVRFAPIPDATYYAPMLYYRKFPGLQANSTNWLMTNAPRVYLFGSLFWAKILLQDDAGAMRYMRLYASACNALQDQDERDRHSGGALTIRNLTGSP